MDFLDDLNKKNRANKESWFLTLRSNYYDHDLDKIIDKAMKDPNTVKLAKLAEKERMKEWLEKLQYSPDQAFHDLKLNQLGEKVFSSPKFELWVKYLDDWNKANFHKKMAMIDGIRGNYKDLDLVPILAAAEKVPSTQKLVSQLQDVLVDKWVAEKKTLAYLKGWLTPGASSDDILKQLTTKLNSV
ncbi:hypothetical protein P3T76_000820 [Phytophthora citrophthora]|uniref:RxLR effector protein n=1 Tax=Phytophthora citrophthora TaxID=4793 RepID=A0AAD9LTX2_9STRA|nr:hypothetical protein P3T76_000820 [Phytophthora citrophthora]